MIIYTDIDFNQLKKDGKSYQWNRPATCPEPDCHSVRLWGHGYVERYFDPVDEPVWIKRWRCADCGSVHTARPFLYWERFSSPVSLIISSLVVYILTRRWLKEYSYQRQQYWYRGFRKQSASHLGCLHPGIPELNRMIDLPIALSSHLIKSVRIQA